MLGRAALVALASAAVAEARHKKLNPAMAAPPTPNNCADLPGDWTGGYGATCGTSPLNDLYSFAWASPPKAGSWVPTMVSGGGWGTGLGQLSPDNSTTTLSLDSGVKLNGNVTGNCSCIAWDNGSWWGKKGPPPPPITDVHIIAMNHLDVGYNGIPGLGLINNIVNRYFSVYFPRAISVAQDLTARGEAPRLIYTTHPWLLHLYMNCPVDFTLSNITLQCPSAAEVQAMKDAVQRGDITWHAAAFNTEYENALNAEMIDVQASGANGGGGASVRFPNTHTPLTSRHLNPLGPGLLARPSTVPARARPRRLARRPAPADRLAARRARHDALARAAPRAQQHHGHLDRRERRLAGARDAEPGRLARPGNWHVGSIHADCTRPGLPQQSWPGPGQLRRHVPLVVRDLRGLRARALLGLQNR